MFAEMLDILGPAAVAVTVAMFVFTYARLPWWRTKWGKSIMIMAVAMFGLAVTTLAWRADQYVTADFSWLRAWPRVLAWWVVAAVYGWKTLVAFHAIRGGRDE